ncbi:AraC family transcriptional regulator [Hydrogenophaga crassostreae]|uniref:AraC family transcriptional regulator n=1 Tax=Hydrogenophaga crassostreae TaxID=1763535 RepID=A0A163CCG6_9BURK|nr:AraC family transcriptional regulator [Hydrogenophaga crassostreae]AOW12258.1 AraC family transcriptional regulator [Hydrogenophaga crassostreae]OAD41206.1 AraC family transcriptional regulator [Hydrogenophaga crassostreae]
MDPLSDVLALLKPRSSVSAGFDAGGEWAVQFDRHVGVKCYAVVSGQCWLQVEGIVEPLALKPGDCFLLPGGRPFRLTNDLGLTPIDARTLFPPANPGGVVTLNGGGDFFLVGSRFALAGHHTDFLLGLLPPVVHIHRKLDRAAMRWCVEHMMQELRDGHPGGHLMAQHLAHMMLVQALRSHMAQGLQGGVGWLFALSDPKIGVAIKAMHAEPALGWTLQVLAEKVGMSRSIFAQRFRETVGTSPMAYLTHWRMLLAGDKLATSSESISTVALALGYGSESAFSTAFKRVMGSSPRQYSRKAQLVQPRVPIVADS